MKAIKSLLPFLSLIFINPVLADGREIYEGHCLSCHQSKGGGVPFFQPSLRGSLIVTGDKELLIDFVLRGTENRENWYSEYDNIMPAFFGLSDKELAEVLSYVRTSFGNEAETISEEEVSKVREHN